jgi:hypothetical protein
MHVASNDTFSPLAVCQMKYNWGMNKVWIAFGVLRYQGTQLSRKSNTSLPRLETLLYSTRKFMTFPNTTAIAYHIKKRQIHLFVCHAILVVFGNAMKLRVVCTCIRVYFSAPSPLILTPALSEHPKQLIVLAQRQKSLVNLSQLLATYVII